MLFLAARFVVMCYRAIENEYTNHCVILRITDTLQYYLEIIISSFLLTHAVLFQEILIRIFKVILEN